MHITSIVTTRSKSCHVKTLHVMLKFNIMCLDRGHMHAIVYVNDDTPEKMDSIMREVKGTTDKIMFYDFGIHIDDASLLQVFEKGDCVVFPAAKGGIDWDMFKEKVQGGSAEPVIQMGLTFDTEVGDKVSDGIYRVKSADPKVWMMNTKAVKKALKQQKGKGLYHPASTADLFQKFTQKELKIIAYTKSVVTVTYPHECISNIIQAAGVKVN